jgi:hypothetical protein
MQEPFVEIEQKEISSALVKVLDVRNHPGNLCVSFTLLILDKLINLFSRLVLIHCNKGKVNLLNVHIIVYLSLT